MTQITDPRDIHDYLTGGHAEFTIKSLKTGRHYTYKASAIQHDPANGFFVHYLNGPDNTSDYRYLGIVKPDMRLIQTKASPVHRTNPAAIALGWLCWKLTQPAPDLSSMEFHHTGKCARCGRKLTTPESIERGIGPVCATL